MSGSYLTNSGVKSMGYLILTVYALYLGFVLLNQQFQFISSMYATNEEFVKAVVVVFALIASILLFLKDEAPLGVLLLSIALMIATPGDLFMTMVIVVLLIVSAVMSVQRDQAVSALCIVWILLLIVSQAYLYDWVGAITDNPAIIAAIYFVCAAISLYLMARELVTAKSVAEA